MVAISLNNDLTNRLFGCEKESTKVIHDLHSSPDDGSKKQSIASLQAASSAKRKHLAIEFLDKEESMDFTGSIFKKNEKDTICKISCSITFCT